MNRLELLVLSRLDNQVQLGGNTNWFKGLKSRDFQTCHGPGQFGRCIQSWRSNLNPYWRIKETKTKNWEISQRHLRKQSPDKNTEYLIMFIFLSLELTIMDFVSVKDAGRRSQMTLDFVSVNDGNSRNISKMAHIIWLI